MGSPASIIASLASNTSLSLTTLEAVLIVSGDGAAWEAAALSNTTVNASLWELQWALVGSPMPISIGQPDQPGQPAVFYGWAASFADTYTSIVAVYVIPNSTLLLPLVSIEQIAASAVAGAIVSRLAPEGDGCTSTALTSPNEVVAIIDSVVVAIPLPSEMPSPSPSVSPLLGGGGAGVLAISGAKSLFAPAALTLALLAAIAAHIA
jgi:hypothetical protein